MSVGTPWQCQGCGQVNSGWSKECGRCEKPKPEACAEPVVVAVYGALGMDSLARLICLDHDNTAYEAWRVRYGHDFPTFAVIAGKECNYQGACQAS